jgi:AraC-like DNA-binding protein
VRSVAPLLALLELGAQRGITADRCLAGSGLLEGDLQQPTLPVAVSQELAVIRNLVRLMPDKPGLGARTGRMVTIPRLGAWGMAMFSCQTPRDVITIAAQYGYDKLSWVLTEPRVEQHLGGLHTVFDDADIPDDIRAFVIERDLAFVVSLLPTIFGRDFPLRIQTSLDSDRATLLADILPWFPIVGGALDNRIIVPAAVLDRTLPNRDDQARRVCEQQCVQLIARGAPARAGVVARAEEAMLRRPAEFPTLQDLAATLHVHPRTLGRRLEAEGMSFRALADDVRRRLALDLLADPDATIDCVAGRLGYADAASFSRAFKRWTGETPGAVSRRCRQRVSPAAPPSALAEAKPS